MTSYPIVARERPRPARHVALVAGLCLASALVAGTATRLWTQSEDAAHSGAVRVLPPAAPIQPIPHQVGPINGWVYDDSLGRSVYFINGLPYGATPNGGP